MTQNGIQWIRPPEKLAQNIAAYGQHVLVALHAAAVRWGQMTQDAVRQGAPWTDRTGNARSGLFYAVDGLGMQPVMGTISLDAQAKKTDTVTIEGSDQSLVIAVGHTVFYGKFLELSSGGTYAVVMSTIEGNLPQLERELKGIFR